MDNPRDIKRFKPERRANPRRDEAPDFENIDWDTTAEMAKEIKNKTGHKHVVVFVGKRKKKT